MSDLVRRPASPEEGTVGRLLRAAMDELRDKGYAALTLRTVARRAGVSPATAYNYFSSKEHLFAAVNLQTIRDLPPVLADGAPVEQRLARLLQDIADTVAPEPELREAFTASMLGNDEPSARMREAIVDEFVVRFRQACGDDLDDFARDTVLAAFVGSMVMAGLGRVSFQEIEERVAGMVHRLR